MAKLFKWLIVLFIPLFSLTLTSCGDDKNDEPDNPNTPTQPTITDEDPEGTIIQNLLIGSSAYFEFDSRIEIEYESKKVSGYWRYPEVEFKLTDGLNFQGEGGAQIVDIGKVNSLSAINDIPMSGWGVHAVVKGHGYILRDYFWADIGDNKVYRPIYKDCYIRIFVLDLLTSPNGDVTGVVIKIQPNWKNRIYYDSSERFKILP